METYSRSMITGWSIIMGERRPNSLHPSFLSWNDCTSIKLMAISKHFFRGNCACYLLFGFILFAKKTDFFVSDKANPTKVWQLKGTKPVQSQSEKVKCFSTLSLSLCRCHHLWLFQSCTIYILAGMSFDHNPSTQSIVPIIICYCRMSNYSFYRWINADIWLWLHVRNDHLIDDMINLLGYYGVDE